MKLLVLTTGQTDVQLVVNNMRQKIGGKNCGEVHDEISKREFEFVDSPRERNRQFVDTACQLPSGKIMLCTPKLDAILRFTIPDSVLVLETTRNTPSDPRLSGTFIEQRLKQRKVAQGDITKISFLIDGEKLEDASHPEDAVLRRAVISRVAAAICDKAKGLKKQDQVFIATTGGMPAVNEAICELVRLYCIGGPPVIALEVPDGEGAHMEESAYQETFHPASGLRARWQALSLIEKGDLLGAWGAVSHLEGSTGQDWIEVARWLMQFASSRPIDPKCNLKFLTHKYMAVRAAIRVELALKMGDIPKAIHGTVAFFESALWDWLNQYVRPSPTPTTAKKRYQIVSNVERLTEKKDNLVGTEEFSEKNFKMPFILVEEKDGTDWYTIQDGVAAAGNLVKHFLCKEALKKFNDALSGEIRSLRNDVAHNEPTVERMKQAKEKMQQAELWSNDDSFLEKQLVANVLTELSVDNPADLWKTLYSDIRKRLTKLY